MTPPLAGTARSLDPQVPSSARPTVRRPRRVSGPARSADRRSPPIGRSTTVGASVALPRPGIALPKQPPRRSNSPARRRAAPRSTQNPGIALRAVDAFERFDSSALLDRLIRGRVWIGLLAFALIGIVAMQLVVLELNTGVGRTLQREALLQRENAQLNIEDSVYSAEDRVAPLAAAAGMTFAPSGTVHFVTASDDDVARAAAALSSARQASSGGHSETVGATVGETGTSPATTEQSTAATSEATGSAEGSSSSSSSVGSESAAQSSEAAAGAGSGSSASASAASPSTTPSPVATTPPSSAGEQATGGSSSSRVAAAPTSTSGPGGGTQAGSRE